ncbi:MAG: hypothetical protein IPK74_36595 [Deltaproteobacteria bacterium]|nr:hypothetical protein [Deltaproteobacteria bacterium]
MRSRQAGDPAAAEPLLVEAYLRRARERSRHDRDRRCAAPHPFTIGYQLARPQEGLLWGRHGEGLVARAAPWSRLRGARLSA